MHQIFHIIVILVMLLEIQLDNTNRANPKIEIQTKTFGMQGHTAAH